MALLLNKVYFKPLAPGIHKVIIGDYKVKADKKDQDYLSLAFAPVSNPVFTHHTVYYATETRDQVATLISNILQHFPELEGQDASSILKAVNGKELPATLEEREVFAEDGTLRVYRNWYIGYVKHSTPTANKTTDTEDDSDSPY